MGREVGGGIGMGKTCEPKAFSFQCMTKFTTKKKKKKKIGIYSLKKKKKNLPANAADGDLGLIPVLGRSPGVGNGCPLQYSCLENSTVSGASQATVHRVTKSQT